MINARELLLKAGQHIGAGWITTLVDTLRSLVIITGDQSQVVSSHTSSGQMLTLSRPIPALIWGRTTEGPIPARDGSGYWGSETVSIYIDKTDSDGAPYSVLDTDKCECFNRMATEVAEDKDIIMIEESGRLFVIGVDC